MSNYAIKPNLKNATADKTSEFAKNTNLANLKPDVHKLDTDKLKNVLVGLNDLKSIVNKLDVPKLVLFPVDCSKIRDAVKNDVVKKIYIYIYIILRLKILKIKYLILLTYYCCQ